MNKQFSLGKIVITFGLNKRMTSNPEFSMFVFESLKRYSELDRGDISEDDALANDHALERGNEERVFAAYKKDDDKIFIITEADRSNTTIMLSSEY